jgi:signal recognition particle subunit SRP54
MGRAIPTAEVYDPKTGTFSPTGSMTVARYWPVATILSDGRVFVAGGQGNADTVDASAELYDPSTGRFSPAGWSERVPRPHDPKYTVDPPFPAMRPRGPAVHPRADAVHSASFRCRQNPRPNAVPIPRDGGTDQESTPPMFDALSERLRKTLGALTGRGRVSEADVDAAMREVRLALLEADVNFKVVKDFVARVRERATGADILDSLTAGQQVVKIVNEELVALLSAGDRTFHLTGSPAVIVLVGLQGSGKTTSAAKLARYIVKQGRRPILVAADPYRPAAADQLQTLGKSLDVPVYRAATGTAVLAIAQGGMEAARKQVRDTVIIDTAGRLTVDAPLMAEIAELTAALKPAETLLVVDAMTGQEAVHVAEAFAAAVPVTGLVLTKIDGDARGGAALSISAVTGLPVKFLGTGEKTDALEPFYPDRLAGRILGMGDVLTLIERAQETYDEKQAARMTEKLRKNSFTLEDMLEQMEQVQKMGPMGQLIEMIPGLGGMAKQAQAAVDRGDLRRVQAIIRSMTPQERRDPNVLNGSRRRRIAQGSGTRLQDVNQVVKQFSELQKMMKQMSGGRFPRRIPGMPGQS